MNTSIEQLEEWLQAPSENEHLEFKEAKQTFSFEKLVKYCCALANEHGGRMILGITNKPPRKVAGSSAFKDLQKTKIGLIERLHLRVEIEEMVLPEGRMLIVNVPSRPLGMPIQYNGAYWMRRGGDLVPMLPDMLRRIFAETEPDFSSEICSGATIEDIDHSAADEFRKRWIAKFGNQSLASLSIRQLLHDAELMLDDGMTYASLILMGSRSALGKRLPNAEVVFEYRSSEGSIEYQQRAEFREGLLLFYDRLWDIINTRNTMQHFRDGLFVLDIPTFNEDMIRESVLNAVCHRDYRLAGSVFVRQFPARIEIVSPGGFPEGITKDNLLYHQAPRNRRIAEALARCGLVERSGQGFDRIYTSCIRETKPLPDFSLTDNFHVGISLEGTIKDPAFLRFLEGIGAETQQSFFVDDFLALEYLRSGKELPDNLKGRLQKLRRTGVVELVGKGRGSRYILSRRFYDFTGRKGAYTRSKWLDRETQKELLLKHISNQGNQGRMREFEQVLPELTRTQINRLLRELKEEGRVEFVGAKKTGHWEVAK